MDLLKGIGLLQENYTHYDKYDNTMRYDYTDRRRRYDP